MEKDALINRPYDLKIGTVLVIGEPANHTYLYLRVSPKQETQPKTPSLDPRKLIGQTVNITGILTLTDGNLICILSKKDKNHFFSDQPFIYAEGNNAISAKELLLP